MAAIPSDEYSTWHQQTTCAHSRRDQAARKRPKADGQATREIAVQRAQAIAPYPPDLLSCLTKDTAWWKQHGWSQPPGSQRVLYWRRNDSLRSACRNARSVPQVRPGNDDVAVANDSEWQSIRIATMYSNTSASGVVSPCDHWARGKGPRVHCPELTGKDEQGRPLQIGHDHAHTLPLDLDGDGRIDHLVVYAKMGLGGLAQRAIRTVRRTWTKGGVGDLQLALVGSGHLNLLRALPAPLNYQIERLLGPQQGARIWESVTPFVCAPFCQTPRKKYPDRTNQCRACLTWTSGRGRG